MANVNLNFEKSIGKIKPMHAVNNGPWKGNERSNYEEFKKVGFPLVRNHDASFFSGYGGEHIVDVHLIFPDFSKNPYDPESYDFDLTDDYIASIISVGSNVLYRLGSRIEHHRKKYGTLVPRDFNKWAVICEHIIRHYNEGWANGFYYNIVYWEIWNEPNTAYPVPAENHPNWSGTPEQFYSLYCTAAIHLKKCFPNIKIGGPALTGTLWPEYPWIQDFFKALTANEKKVPMDFYSWHCYPKDPNAFGRGALGVRSYIDSVGYPEAELILDEWNLPAYENEHITDVHGMRGAAYCATAMIGAQKSPIDMFMYYDARPGTTYNGLFDFYTLKPLRSYYTFLMFSALYSLRTEVESTSDDEEIMVCAALGKRKAVMISHYSLERNAPSKNVTVNGLEDGEYQLQWLDEDRCMYSETITATNGKISITMPSDCVVLITDTD